jgi:phosphoglycolate phosphatase
MEDVTIESPVLTRNWTCILFDLDGTLVDSAPGITGRLASTLTELGLPVPGPEELLRYVGPPILDSFRDFAGLNPEQSQEALTIYRRQVAEVGAAHDSAIFPGISGLLTSLKNAGIPLALATSKPESQALVILEHYGLTDKFDVITGASEDEVRSAKADVVAEAVRRLTDKGIDLSQTIMVGDRHHDVTGAAAHGIPTVLVEWGYGSPAEADGAIAVVHSVDALRQLLLG